MGQTQPVTGTVEVWHDDDGWGVLRTPDGMSVFCHSSDLEMSGYKTLTPGASVVFDYEVPGQDGCEARVLTAARPAGGPGVDEVPLGGLLPEPGGLSGAYVSTVTYSWTPNAGGDVPPLLHVTADRLTPGDPTPGMMRGEAVVLDGVWSGTAVTQPGVTGGWHHHGGHDSIVYVVRGAFDVETAAGVVHARPGDFVHVPPWAVHRESNSSEEQAEVVLFRRGDGPVVVNVDGPEGAGGAAPSRT
jgi:cold shock CspA family protein